MSITDNLSYGEFMSILIGGLLVVAIIILLVLYYLHVQRGRHGID